MIKLLTFEPLEPAADETIPVAHWKYIGNWPFQIMTFSTMEKLSPETPKPIRIPNSESTRNVQRTICEQKFVKGGTFRSVNSSADEDWGNGGGNV
jgi:hypothetical protein